MTGSGVAIGMDQVTFCSFCIYGYETISCFVEQGELVSGSSKGEGLPFELVQHFCYRGGIVVSFKGESGCSGRTASTLILSSWV